MEHLGEGTQKPIIAIPEASSQPGIRRSVTASMSASDSDENPVSVDSPVRRQDQWRLLRRKSTAFLKANPALRKSLIVSGPPVLVYITLRIVTFFLSLVMGTSEGTVMYNVKADQSYASHTPSVHNVTAHPRESTSRFTYKVDVPPARPKLLNAAAWKELLTSQGGRVVADLAALSTGGPMARISVDNPNAPFDHNLSISSPCLTHRPLLQRAYQELTPGTMSGIGRPQFVLSSGYRVSMNQFAVVGLYLRALHGRGVEMPSSCFWTGTDGTHLPGNAHAVFPGALFNLMYETVVVECRLHASSTGREGGQASILLGSDVVTIYREKTTAMSQVDFLPTRFLGVCTSPIYRPLNTRVLDEWIRYSQQYAEVEYFVFNDGGGVDAATMKVLVPYIDANVLEIVDMRGAYRYEAKQHVLSLNDCIYRMRSIAKWVLLLDFDELLFVHPPHSLRSLLQQHATAPYLSFGTLQWSTKLCRESGGTGAPASPLSRMLFHAPEFTCYSRASHGMPAGRCTSHFGQRKMVVNPKLVTAMQIYRVIEPSQGGVDLEASIAHINHFQGLQRRDANLCSEVQAGNRKPEWWVEDYYMADISRRLHL